MRRLLLVFVLVLSSVAVAGCGEDRLAKANKDEVRSVVLRFASAADASACDLLTADALRNVYGGFNSPLAKARAACRKRSARFRGEQVKITKLTIVDRETARVAALSPDEKFTYSVTVRRPAKRWLIDQITVHKVR